MSPRLWRRVKEAEIIGIVERGTIPAEVSPSWQSIRFEWQTDRERREQARKRQERRVLARLLLQTRNR